MGKRGYKLSYSDIIIRLGVACAIGMVVGLERERRSRPAGIRTHVILCAGAAIIALIQMETVYWALDLAKTNSDLADVVRADPLRLVAQIISGVGFLGAGTIILTKQKVTGLTTATSLWTVAGLGIASGMGYYDIAIIGGIMLIIVLYILKKVIHVNSFKKIEVNYVHRVETKEFLSTYFEEKGITLIDVDFNVDTSNERNIYRNVYTIENPKDISYPEIIEDISAYKNVTRIRVVTV